MDLEATVIQTIDMAFHPIAIEKFLEGLNQRRAHIASIQEAAPDLTEFLPAAAYDRDHTFLINFWNEVYQKLDRETRGRVDEHYTSLVQAVPMELKRKFPKIFPRDS